MFYSSVTIFKLILNASLFHLDPFILCACTILFYFIESEPSNSRTSFEVGNIESINLVNIHLIDKLLLYPRNTALHKNSV